MGNGTAKTSGLAVFLVGVQGMVVQCDICKRENVFIRYDVRSCRQLGVYFHVIVIESQDFRARHCSPPISIMPSVNSYGLNGTRL